MSSPAVEFLDVSRDYVTGLWPRHTLRAVDRFSLSVQAGEVFGLLGPNRSGKTTLVKMLLSLCRPTSGRIVRLGQPASVRRTLARIGYVHENPAFPRYLDARRLLWTYGALSLVPHDVLRTRVEELLGLVGLADRAGDPIWRYSKGMVQRLGLAQALINDPELLVLDEPTEGLDLAGRQLLREVIARQRERGRTVLLVTHVLPEAEQLCGRVAVIRRGALVYTGKLDDLRRGATETPRSLEQALQELYAG